jgi:hypothetical protein
MSANTKKVWTAPELKKTSIELITANSKGKTSDGKITHS